MEMGKNVVQRTSLIESKFIGVRGNAGKIRRQHLGPKEGGKRGHLSKLRA